MICRLTAHLFFLVASVSLVFCQRMEINERGYYEKPGVNVMLFDDFYPEGHQGGLTIVQCGVRLAANGDLRLDPTPGQWSPVPRAGKRTVDRLHGSIAVELWYPDSSKNRRGFNPIDYPELAFRYTIRTENAGDSIRLFVDLDKPLPRNWADKVGFNLELFPGAFFGEHYFMDGVSGIFPRQANDPVIKDWDGNVQSMPMAVGKTLTVAPGDQEKELRISSRESDLLLIDGRGLYNNGWFVVRSVIPAQVTRGAISWVIVPVVARDWRYNPVIQVSQMGYHPLQKKFAVIELDRSTNSFEPIRLVRITSDSSVVMRSETAVVAWGEFLRYKYLRFDFSDVKDEGIYRIFYGNESSNEFEIRRDIYARHVWQPTLEYFLPEQMCHMRVQDRYKVWHGLCHMDDALMAPVNHNHFDGYHQHESTLTKFASGQHVPGLNIGGWHDAGDYDLRVESQAETVYKLALAYEFFRDDCDQTSVDQSARTVTLHKPDGKPDFLQQIEHGVLSIAGGYASMGRLYRGIICPTLQQYVHLGDASTMSDNLVFDAKGVDPVLHRPLPTDDRWVFTEENPARELFVARCLAAAARALRSYNSSLAETCLMISEDLYRRSSSSTNFEKFNAAGELFLTTSKAGYQKVLLENSDMLGDNIEKCGEVIGRVTEKLHDRRFTARIELGVKALFAKVAEEQKENPYGVPYRPRIWGAGWEIQELAVKELFLYLGFPRLFPADYTFNALNFVLGCHPGENTSSFVSGVGVHSLTVAYGANRDEWSYIPGGVASGTALIRPDLPELKVWPYFWQQTEYVMGGGAADFILLAMAADRLLNK